MLPFVLISSHLYFRSPKCSNSRQQWICLASRFSASCLGGFIGSNPLCSRLSDLPLPPALMEASFRCGSLARSLEHQMVLRNSTGSRQSALWWLKTPHRFTEPNREGWVSLKAICKNVAELRALDREGIGETPPSLCSRPSECRSFERRAVTLSFCGSGRVLSPPPPAPKDDRFDSASCLEHSSPPLHQSNLIKLMESVSRWVQPSDCEI